MRLDRLATLCVVRPLQLVRGNGRRTSIPILMYHGVRERLDGRHPYFETSTSPAVFARQMKFLHDQGYQTWSLGEAVQQLSAGAPVDKKVVITFDDGYLDFYTQALPVLQHYGFSATMFLPTGRIGDQRICLKGNEYMTWAEVRKLPAHLIAIGSHTVTHPELKELQEPEIDRELGESKRTIEDKLGVPVTSFAYPYAFPETDRNLSQLLVRLLEKHGYKNGVSTIIGTASAQSPRYFLPRLPVNSWDDTSFLKAKLEGRYNWLHVPQVLTKVAKDFMQIRPQNIYPRKAAE